MAIRNQLMAQYLRDPQVSMFQKMLEEGTSTAPVQSPWQGLARMAQAGVGGLMAKKLRDEYQGESDKAGLERQNAVRMALGIPAETQNYGDTTINWNEQKPNIPAAAAMLNSPDNESLANTLIGTKFSQDQTVGDQAFRAQQQAQRFEQEQQLINQRIAAERAQKQWELENNPENAVAKLRAQYLAKLVGGGSPTLGQVFPQAGQAQPTGGLTPRAPIPTSNQAPQPTRPDQIDPMATWALTGAFPKGMAVSSSGGFMNVPTDKMLEDKASAAIGKQRLTESMQNMLGDYTKLDELGGIVNTGKPFYKNLVARASGSEDLLWGFVPGGQSIGGAFGTQEQTIRDNIKSVRSLLIPQIMQATGMSAKQLDSNTELNMYLRSLADPSMSVQSAQKIIQNVNDLFGVKGGLTDPRIAEAKQAIAQGADPEQVKARLSSMGLSTEGF